MIEIRHNGGVILTPKLEDSSYKRRDLSGTDEIVLKFSSNEHVDIPVGSTVEWRGSTYTLETPESLKMQHSEHFEYVATFSAPSVRIGKYKVINQVDGRVDFHLTAKPKEHLQLIVDNLNKRESGWAIGNCIEDIDRLIQYNHTDCRTALSSIAEEFKTELFIEGKVISLSTVEKDKSNPVTLAYGEGKGFLGGIGRTHDKDAGARVAYVKTSDRNIDYSKYKSKSLRLKRNHRFSYRGYSFVTDDSGLSVRFADAPKDSREEVVDLSNIYPSRVGIVSEVIEVPVKTKDGQETTFYDFTDTTIPDALDFDKEVISGEKLTIIFQSGMLSGREFDVKYHAKELAGEKPKKAKRFEIVQREEDGVTMPLGAFVPAIGDKYAVFHCSLPQSYIDEAEKKALEKACDFLIEELKPRFEFSGEVDGIFAKNKWSEIAHKLEVGKFVSFTDERFQPEPILVRIVGVTEFLNNPYSPKIELSNAPVTGNVFSEIKEAIREEQTLRYKQDVKIRQLEARTYKDTETVRDMIEQLKVEGFDSSIKPETLHTMQAVIGSPELQFDFVRSEFDLTETPFAYSFGKGGTEITIPQQYLRKYKNSNKLSSVKESVVYTIPKLTYSFKEDQRQMYLYAQTAPVKRFVLSAEPLQKSEDNNLVGLVYASGDSRRMTPLHGFTEITPGQLKTDLISSQDGKSFWDLINGKFQSKGDFVLGDIEGGGQVFAKVGDKFYMRGIMINVGSGRRTIEDAIAEQEEKAEAERKAREAAIEKERREREQADAAERKAREDKEREFTQAIERAKQSGARDMATLTDLLNKANQKLGALEKQVDKEVSNWFYAGAPSATKLPESEWTTNAIKANHINDTYTSIDKSGRYQGKSWRYTTEYKWVEIHDTQISQALSMAAKAQTTADGKSTTYLAKPIKYEEGDTWVLESSQALNGISYEAGTMLFAKQGSSAFIESHWVDKVRYIGTTQLKKSEEASKRAWEAYANAQAESERVKAEAHADGKVTAEEQARIDAVNKALQAAKAYAEAQDKLLKTQQEAYADGKVTAAERNAIAVSQARAKLAEENAKAYADGKITAEEKARIAAAQKAYDDAVAKAKELDGQIQVGGRNLFIISNFRSLRRILLSTNDTKVLPLSRGEDSTGVYFTQTDQQFGVTSRLSTYVLPSTIYSKECYNDIVRTPGITLWESFEVKVSAKMDLWMDDKNKVTVSPEDGWVRLFKKRNGGNEYTRMYGIYGTFPAANVKVWYRRPMITEGDVRVITYTPAPEDVQAEIDAVERGYQKLIERVDVEFAISNSRDTAPESGWQTNAPTPARGQALWQRTKVYLKDGTTEVRGVTCIQGKDGLDGKDGAKGGDGADGRGIAKIVELYYLSSSNTALANGAWTETAPTPKEGFWIWTKTRIHYSTGEQIETQPICVTGNKGDKGDRGQDAVNFDMGRMLHTDPTFMEGYNEIYRYDNARQGAVTVTRIARPADCPTTSSHALQVHFDSTIASVWPGIGGFLQYTNSRANAIFVHRFIANVPAGYKLNWAGNPIGVGGSHKWVTPNAGTGKYEEYICVTYCGSSGTFSNFGHMYLTGARATMDVIIAYATMYDMTDAPDYYAKIAEAKQATVDLKTYTDGAFADGIISKTEAKAIATYKQQVNESWASVFAEYERVYANTLLSGTPKTTLLNSKVSLSGAKDQLLSAITSAIADGKATTTEAANVDTKYNAYNSALSTFQKALEEAREAIRKNGVSEIYVGGKNLINLRDVLLDYESVPLRIWYERVKPIEGDNTFTLSFEYKLATNDPATNRRICIGAGGIIYDRNVVADDRWHYKKYTFKLPTSTDKYPDGALGSTWLCDYGTANGRNSNHYDVRRVQLERGNVATEYSLSEEDYLEQLRQGERNLLLRSGRTITNSDYLLNKYRISEAGRALKKGDLVTLVLKGALGAGKSFFPYNSGGIVEVSSLVVRKTDIDGQDIAVIRGVWRMDDTRPGQNTTLDIYAVPSSVSSKSTIEWIKLVRGHVTSRQWTEAPEDVEARRKADIDDINKGVNDANKLIKTLDTVQKKLEQGLLSKADVEGIQYLLDSLQKGSTDFAGGILLTNDIILSEPNSGKVTATLSGSAVQGHKALRLGIQDSSKEMTAFSNDGTGHVGPLYFRGGMLEFVDESVDTQVLAIGKGTMSKRLNDIINSNSVNSYLINNASGSLNYHNDVESWTLNVSNDNTKIVVKGKLRARGQAAQSAGGNRSFSGCGITLSIDGVGTIGTAGSMCTYVEGLPPNCTLGTATINSVFYLNRGRYTVTVRQKGNGETSYEDLSLQQIWSSNKSFNAISEKGVRFYGNKDKYFDLNYSLPSNLETVEIRGGMNVDYINTSGAVLAGAQFTPHGTKIRQMGRYANKDSGVDASAGYSPTSGRYTVYHSIGHTRYIPQVQVAGTHENNGGWSLAPRVFDISSYSFTFSIRTNGDNPSQCGFSYVAYLTD